MNLYKKLRLFHLKLRWFLYGYEPFDFDGMDSSFEEFKKCLIITELIDYIISIMFVIGIPLLLLSIILAFIFQNGLIFLITFKILLGLFLLIIFFLTSMPFLLELFLDSFFTLFKGYNRFFRKNK